MSKRRAHLALSICPKGGRHRSKKKEADRLACRKYNWRKDLENRE